MISTPAFRQEEFTPTTRAEKFVMGNEPIKSMQTGTVSPWLQSKGFSPTTSTLMASGLALAGTAMDVTGAGKAKKGLEAGEELVAARKATPEIFEGFKDITTKILRKLEGKTTVSPQYIRDLTNQADLKMAERELIRGKLDEFLVNWNQKKIPAKDFAESVKEELLPLKKLDLGVGDNPPTRYDRSGYHYALTSSEGGGAIADYSERIYESPIKTSAGETHFSDVTDNYFAHTRIEDMADNQTRRVIEVQSDLFQKRGIEEEISSRPTGFMHLEPVEQTIERAKNLSQKEAKEYLDILNTRGTYVPRRARFQELSNKADANYAKIREKELSPLLPYRNTWHERVIKEEIKQAAIDGKSTLQIPTGETAMKIEGLGETDNNWVRLTSQGKYQGTGSDAWLTPENLKIGQNIARGPAGGFDEWIITDVLGDGKFKAVPKEKMKSALMNTIEKVPEHAKETFDISGKVDTKNAQYMRYEDIGKYLKNKYNAQRITDPQGVSWFEMPIKPEQAKLPIEAYGLAPLGLLAVGQQERLKRLKERSLQY